jgi:YVTN family beta-propeller protein
MPGAPLALSGGAVVARTVKELWCCGRVTGRLVVASVLLAASALCAVPALARNAVILNSDDDSVSIVDTTTYKEISRNYIGRSPHHLMPTPDGKYLIVAAAGGNQLIFIDRDSREVAFRREASDPYQVGFSPDTKWFVATSLRLDRIDIYDGKDYRLVHRLQAPRTPSHIGFSPDSSTAYVTLQGSNSLMAIDLASGKPIWTAPVGPQPAGVLVRPSGTVLVGIMGSDHIAEVDPKDGKVLRRIQTGRGAHNFLLSPDGKVLYVSNRVAGSVAALDAETLTVKSVFPAPGGPDDMAFSLDGQELWVTGRWRAAVNVIDRNAGTLKATIPVGRSPHGIFVW